MLIHEISSLPAAIEALVDANPLDTISAAIRCHKWPQDILDLVSSLLFRLEARRTSVEPIALHKEIELSIHLIETSESCLVTSYNLISEVLRKEDSTETRESKWNLGRLIPLISKHLPTLKIDQEKLILCKVLARLAACRFRFLAQSDEHAISELIKPYLDYKRETVVSNDENSRAHLVSAYADLLQGAGSPSTLKPYMQRGLIRPLASVILNESHAHAKAIACAKFVTALSIAGSEDFRVAAAWPETVPALAQAVINPNLTLLALESMKVLFTVVKDGPRVHKQYLYGPYYDGASSNPYLDYLYAHIYDDLVQINAATPNHPTLTLMVLLDAVGLPVPF